MTVEQLAAAIPAATAMDIKEKERVCDMILATQPNLLASVLALRSFGIRPASFSMLPWTLC